MRAEYLKAYPQCQYSEVMGRYGLWRMDYRRELCIEHIWNRKGPTSEHWSNYATVMPAAHEWKHENSTVARVAIMWLKLSLREQDERHFDLDALRKASGFWIPGWIELQLERDNLPAWAGALARDILEQV